MTTGDTLRMSEALALEGSQFVANVSGRAAGKQKSKSKLVSLGAAGFIVAIIAVFAGFFSFGNIIPDAISTRLIEETDVQYADAVGSKVAVFQQALADGDVPANTVKRLADNGVEVSGTALLYNGQMISADEFPSAVMHDTGLYNAFTKATYARAAYYYDTSATEVFNEIGASRNNYAGGESFDTVMSKAMGEGSNINVNNVALFEWEDEETGEIISEYDEVGETGNSNSEAGAFIESVREKNVSWSSNEATMNAADALSVADTIAKEQKSSLFFVAFMENISKMKAGYGNETKINDAMNYLYKRTESSVVDVETGEMVTSYGSMLESPSLYAVLAGEKVDANKIRNYSSDRVLKTVENRIGVGGASDETFAGTVTSTESRLRGSIGRFLEFGGAEASADGLAPVTETLQSSLVDNSFDSVYGIRGGEMLVEGAVNVGKELAKASGASAGDASAVRSYARMTSDVLAMDARVDRMNRSPFDITSRNTFLGAIVYNFAVNFRSAGTLFNNVASFSSTVGSAVGGLMPATLADEGPSLYLSSFGECEKINYISAEGSAGCAMIATFDISTLIDIFDDSAFAAFMEENTVMEGGTRVIKSNSKLADYIKYNNRRKTPIGVMDGGILEALKGGLSSVPFISDILSMVVGFLDTSEEDKRIANGAAFVNSSSNPDWETYKYAQRYVSLARATENLRQYDGEATAYTTLKYFEGPENPVVAFTRTLLAQH